MRRVRSQLDNLATQPSNHPHVYGHMQIPVGSTHQTDKVQRQLEAMGMQPTYPLPPHNESHPGMQAQYPAMQAPYPQAMPPNTMPPNAMPPQAMPSYAFPQPPAGQAELGNIRSSLDRLTAKLQNVVQAQSSSQKQNTGHAAGQFTGMDSSMLNQKLDRITAELAGLRKFVADMASADPAHYDLDGLRQVVDANYSAIAEQISRIAAAKIDPDLFARAVETSHHELAGHLNQIRISVDQMGASDANVHSGDFQNLEARLEDITRSILALSAAGQSNDNLERIEARISDLARTVDTYAADAASVASAGKNEDLSGLLAEIQSGLAALDTRISTIAPVSGDAIDGMAAHLNRLSEKLDNLSVISAGNDAASGPGDNSALLNRLDTLVERVELINSGAADPSQLVAVESQLGRLSGEIESMSGALSDIGRASGDENPSAIMLEQLQHVVTRIDQLSAESGTSSHDVSLAALEQQISAIAEQLGNGQSQAMSLAPIEERLGGIEQQLGASRDIAIEIATQAAEAAVDLALKAVPQGDNGDPHAAIDTETINSLSRELRQLYEHTQNANGNNLETFNAVRDSLTIIVDRLSTIESRINRQEAAASANNPANVIHDAVHGRQDHQEWYGGNNAITGDEQAAPELDQNWQMESDSDQAPQPLEANDQGGELPEVTAPDLSIGELPDSAPAVLSLEDDMPLEPGSGGPDLAALVRQANQRRDENPEKEAAPTGTDFIAAARRAAQAAVTEADSKQNQVKKSSGKGPLKNLPGLFRKRKKFMVLAAAAALVIALALPLATRLMDSKKTQLTQVPSPVNSSQMSQPKDPGEVMPDPTGKADNKTSSAGQSGLVTPAPGVMPPDNSNAGVQSAMAKNSAGALDEPHTDQVSEVSTFMDTGTISFGTDELKAAARNNNPAALFEIGRRFTDGVGTQRNLAEAAKWYEHAAALGFAPAQYRIGNFHEKGHGLEKNAQKAADWYEKAAQSGNIIAMHNLAVLNAEGKLGDEPDMATAFNWFKKAAEFGVRDSQVNAGIFYTNGVGSTGQNLVEAYKWFAIAAKAGDSDASTKRDIIANALPTDKLDQARAETELWKPLEVNQGANSVTILESWKDGASERSATRSKNEMISQTQILLAKIGFDPGPADGLMGDKTRNAIMAFQQRTGMKINGKISPALIDALKAVSI